MQLFRASARPSVCQRVQDRLKYYPLLWAAAAGVAEQALRRAVELAREYVGRRLVFENQKMLLRWLATVAYRESLRLPARLAGTKVWEART